MDAEAVNTSDGLGRSRKLGPKPPLQGGGEGGGGAFNKPLGANLGEVGLMEGARWEAL